jgi:uncharacterized protein YjiS (DUF1127 family)
MTMLFNCNLTRLVDWYNQWRERVNATRVYNQTVLELSRLSDAELRDIGITRGEIHSIAMENHFDNRRSW